MSHRQRNPYIRLAHHCFASQLNRHYGPEDSQHIVRLLHNFEFQSHLCLVFELLSMNVYELIAENNVSSSFAALMVATSEYILILILPCY